MAIDTTNLQAAIAAKIAGEDSAATSSELLQYLRAANQYGTAQYYTSAASLPTADTSLEGQLALVYTGDEFSGNGLYLCTGTEWYEVQDLDSVRPSSQAQGSNFGYSSGGFFSPPSTYYNIIEKFSFTSDGNASDVGDLTVARRYASGQSSTDNGYTAGGYNEPPSTYHNIIDKFPFSSDTNASDVGDLTVARATGEGQSSTVSGYTSGGYTGAYQNIIDKFPFSSDANASDVGDMTVGRYHTAGQSSTTHGYASGGGAHPLYYNIIEKFPFSSDANATDVGDLTSLRFRPAGQNSFTHGYVSGGQVHSTPTLSVYTNIIEKFPFASDGNASDVGDLTQARAVPAGQSSTVSGYTSGGFFIGPPGAVYHNIIDKFPFASDENATDVGDLSGVRIGATGQQN